MALNSTTLFGVVLLEVAKPGSVTGFQPGDGSGPSTGFVAAIAKMNLKAAAISLSPTQKSRASRDSATTEGQFFDDPSQWRDSRRSKTNSKLPNFEDSDFEEATTRDGLWTDDPCTPFSVQAKLISLQDTKAGPILRCRLSGVACNGDKSSQGKPWKKRVQDLTRGWDDQKNKHKKEALSTGSGNAGALQGGTIRRKAGKSSSDGEIVPKSGISVRSSQRNEFFWTRLISRHTKSGQGRQALRAFEDMQKDGVEPSSYTFVAVLKACSGMHDLESVKQIHDQVLNSRFQSDLYVGNMLVSVYAKCGSLEDARHAFESMPHRDVVSWNAMILGYAQNERGKGALELYRRMQHEGVVPNHRTYVAALKACSSLPALEVENGAAIFMSGQCLQQVRAIHSEIVKDGLQSDPFVGTMLVVVYAKCGSLVDARSAFDGMPHHDVVSWTAIILGYAQVDEGETALQLYTQMQQEGILPNDRTYIGTLKACISLATSEVRNAADGILLRKKCLGQVKVIHSEILKYGYQSDVFVGSMLVDAYAKLGNLVDARHVFDRMPHRNVVSWTAIILGYAQMDDGEQALQLYTRMQEEGVVPNDRTYVGALKAYSSLAASTEGTVADGVSMRKEYLEQVRRIHSQIVKRGLQVDIFVGTMLVDVYAKCGSLVDARRIFDNMPHRNVVSWTAMIVGYAQMGEGEVALELYARMQEEGVVPNDRTFVGALKACGSLAELEKGKEIHAQILEAGLEAVDSFVISSLIDMYGKCGSMVDAQQVFDALPSKDIVAWSALIAGYAYQGESELVFHLFQRMKDEGVQPNGITFLSILTVCSHVGLVDMGQKYFGSMVREYGIAPTIEHYTCMVDLLGRAGYVDKAVEMVKTMPLQPISALWKSVLGACRKWNDVELGRQAFDFAVNLDKNDAAIYVLMSNIYSAAHMLEEAKEIDAMRVKSKAWKQPGQSRWTNIDGIAHVFGVGDRGHRESQDMYAKVGDLLVKTTKQGYTRQLHAS